MQRLHCASLDAFTAGVLFLIAALLPVAVGGCCLATNELLPPIWLTIAGWLFALGLSFVGVGLLTTGLRVLFMYGIHKYSGWRHKRTWRHRVS